MTGPHPIAVLLAGAAIALTACGHAENYRWSEQQSVQPRLASIKPPTGSQFGWTGPNVAIYSYANPAPARPGPGVKDLAERAQAAVIAALNDPRAAKSGAYDVAKLMSNPLVAPPPAAEGVASFDTVYDRTLVATVTKGIDAQIGDRLVWTWIDIQPLNFTFNGYTVLATDNQTLNIESIQNQTTASLQGQAGRTSSVVSDAKTAAADATSSTDASRTIGGALGLTGSLSNQYTTSASINQQYVKLSADITEKELRIYRESERNLDVAGNTLISLKLVADPYLGAEAVTVHRVTELVLTKDGKFLDPDAITISAPTEVAPPPCPLTAKVALLYQLRRPLKNARSYVEGEQSASYINSRWPVETEFKEVELIPASQVRPKSWQLHYAGGILEVVDMFEQKQWLDFSSYEQARDFVIWLGRPEVRKWYARNRGGYPLGKGGLKLAVGGALPETFTPQDFNGFAAGTDPAKRCAAILHPAASAPTTAAAAKTGTGPL